MAAKIGAFENLNEDVMDVIIEHLPNADVLSLNNAYPKLGDFCELMEKRANQVLMPLDKASGYLKLEFHSHHDIAVQARYT